MDYNFAKKEVRVASRNKIIIMLILIIGIVAAILIFAPSPTTLYFGEPTFETAEEAEQLMAEENEYVQVTAEDLFDTGYEYTEDNVTKAKYYAFWTDEKCIICKVDKSLTEEEYANYHLRGRLKRATGIESQVVNALRKDAAEYIDSDMIADYVIDTKDTRIVPQIIVGLGILVVLVAFINIITAIVCIGNYKKSKHFKKMGTDIEVAERVNDAISSLYNKGVEPIKMSSVQLMGDWMIDYSLTSFQVYHKDAIVWIYKTITTHKTNGIKTGTSYEVLLKGKNKESICLIASNEEKADKMLDDLVIQFPHAIMGFTDELSALYEKDRAGFLAVQERYKLEQQED